LNEILRVFIRRLKIKKKTLSEYLEEFSFNKKEKRLESRDFKKFIKNVLPMIQDKELKILKNKLFVSKSKGYDISEFQKAEKSNVSKEIKKSEDV